MGDFLLSFNSPITYIYHFIMFLHYSHYPVIKVIPKAFADMHEKSGHTPSRVASSGLVGLNRLGSSLYRTRHIRPSAKPKTTLNSSRDSPVSSSILLGIFTSDLPSSSFLYCQKTFMQRIVLGWRDRSQPLSTLDSLLEKRWQVRQNRTGTSIAIR